MQAMGPRLIKEGATILGVGAGATSARASGFSMMKLQPATCLWLAQASALVVLDNQENETHEFLMR